MIETRKQTVQWMLSSAMKEIGARRKEQLRCGMPLRELRIGKPVSVPFDDIASIYGMPVKISIIVEDADA